MHCPTVQLANTIVADDEAASTLSTAEIIGMKGVTS